LDEPELLSNDGIEGIDLAAVVAYLLLTFGIAVWFGRKQKSTEDFFVGGRRMPWMAVGLSIMATLFSTISYLGVPGEMVKHGVGLFMGYLSVPFSFLVVMYLWVPFFMRLRLTSAYEYLELRFNPAARRLGATLFLLLRLGWMSMVMYGASLALNQVIGPAKSWFGGNDPNENIYWCIIAIGAVAAVYSAIGGIQAVIWVDVLQCILLMAGVLLAIGYVAILDGTGPADWWRQAAENSNRQHTSPPFFSTDLTERVTVVTAFISTFFWTICTHGSDQVVLQRYFSTSDLKAARKSYLVNMVVDLGMACLLSLAGLALLAFYTHHTGLLGEGQSVLTMSDKLFPYFLGHQLPAGCAGLIISAFLCDAIQTLESGANAITAVVSKDVLPTRRPDTTDVRQDNRESNEAAKAELTGSRLLTIIVALVVTGLACWVAHLQETHKLTIIDMMPKFFNMFVGPMAGMFFSGMFLRRCTAGTLLPAAACGIILAVVWSWWEFLPFGASLSETLFGSDQRPTFLLSIALPCLTTVGLAALFSLIFGSSAPKPGDQYTWMSVVRSGTKVAKKTENEHGV
jgi:solute:Na+ symporter, SSS family